jgi:ribosomal protein S18 acetylase RimI-like enzyme
MGSTVLRAAHLKGVRDTNRAFVRPVASNDIAQLARTVGAVVDRLYPAGWLKLEHRLRASIQGQPTAFVVVHHAAPAAAFALASEASKGARRGKLSTFWVAQHARGVGIGGMLLDSRISSWLHSGLDSFSVTVREDRAAQLLPLFSKRGFRAVALDRDRYGDGKHELALEWRPLWLAEAGYDVDDLLQTPHHVAR